VEVIGLTLVAKLVWTERGVASAMLGADSQVVLRTMRGTKGTSGHHLVDWFNAQTKLVQHQHPRARVALRWTLGHRGMEGNK